jgi:hypothetical protein
MLSLANTRHDAAKAIKMLQQLGTDAGETMTVKEFLEGLTRVGFFGNYHPLTSHSG